jgi:CubicO group peptidase (beta-lactamase class C family)
MHAKSEGKSVPGWVNEGCTFEDFPSTHYLGGAGLVSSLDDYSNFARMLLAGGEFGGERIIAQESVKLMSSALIPWEIMPTNWSWGLSVRVITKPDTHLPVGTYGWSGAYGSHFWIDPENEITAVYMKNSRHDGGSGAVTSYNFELDVYSSFED